MKIIVVIFLFISSVGFSQTENDSVYQFVEQEAEFPGGIEEMKFFIAKNIKFPPMMGCLSGKTLLRFIVEKDGSLSQISIVKGVPGCPECDEEAIKVIEQMPK